MSQAKMQAEERLTLYAYWRSSCAWRVRLALAFKGISYEYKAINLLAGEHLTEDYTKINPLQMVPALEADGRIVVDSLAILEYLEERFPQRPLLPHDLAKRATIRQVINLIVSNIQPLQNMRVLVYVDDNYGAGQSAGWARHWIERGFSALEKILEDTAGKYCFGDEITLADVVLVPQLGNADRFKVDMSTFPTILRVKMALYDLHEVRNSVPQMQPDAT